jgi:hypothetical protein
MRQVGNIRGMPVMFHRVHKYGVHAKHIKKFNCPGNGRSGTFFALTNYVGLTCKKGGWDTLRHYEIIAAGSVLLFRDLHKKPESCSPQDIPAPSYSSQKDLSLLTEKLLPNGIPSDEYFRILVDQRNWLYKKGTTQARAREIIKIINHEKNSHN